MTKLANKGTHLKASSVGSLVSLVCRLTKFAWLDEGSPAIREIVIETNKFLTATFHHCIIGMKLFNALVTEMNYKNKNRSLTQHRKVAVSFRDNALHDIFEISLSMLNSLATRALPFSTTLPPNEAAVVECQLLDQAISLLSNCLNFDFIGVLPDEASDEAATLQVPNNWKDRIQTGSTLRLLFNLYKGCTTGKISLFVDASAPPIIGSGTASSNSGGGGAFSAAPMGSPGTTVFGNTSGGGGGASQPMRDFSISLEGAAQALDCISAMVSVRRSLFTADAERKRYLVHIMRGVCEILREKQGLKDEACYHNFCKLLSRIKNNQQLTDLIKSEGYAEWLNLTASFTIEACNNPSWSSNSMNYILGLWGRLVASVPYARLESSGNSSAMAVAGIMGIGSGMQGGGGTSSMPDVQLDKYVPSIVGAYIRGRVDLLTCANQDIALDELSDLENIDDQLENMPTLCRYVYEENVAIIRSIMDPIMVQYERVWTAIRSSPAAVDQHIPTLRVLECQLAYLVAIIGAVIGGGGAHSSSSSAHALMRATSASQSINPVGEEACDAELCRQVFTLMMQGNRTLSEVASRLPSALAASQDSMVLKLRVDVRLESSILYFMDQFRKAYICDASGMPPPLNIPKAGEAAWSGGGSRYGVESTSSSSMLFMRPSSASATEGRVSLGSGGMMDAPGTGVSDGGVSSKGPTSYQEMLVTATGRQRTFLMMFDRMGLGDHCVVVTHMVLKLANNLRFWGNDDTIIKRSNEVLHDLVFSFASGRLLLTIDEISQMLVNHGQQYFPFLANPRNVRHRTTFYTSLARLVFFEDDSERFDPFIAPLLSVLDSIAPSIQVRDDRIGSAIIGVSRDLRGVLAAAHNKSSYNQCFDALFPHHIDTLLRGLEVWTDNPKVTTSVLKFFSELVLQRGSRISFGNSSPNGILLFKRASQAIIVYGSRLMSQTPPASSTDLYPLRYKGIYISAQILSRCIDGGFVNFGVLEHYQDRSFSQALEVVLQLLLGINPPDLMTHPKVALSYMTVMHYICRSHLEALAALPPQAFLQAVRSISEGLDSLDQEITSQAASALDQLSSHFVRISKKDTPLATQLRNQVSANPTLFQTLMNILFNILVFSEQANHYTLARPMLPIMLAADAIQPDVMQALQAKLVAAQPLLLQERMSREFENLTKEISKSLDALNRDRFLQRLSAFRIAVREFAISM